MGGLHRVRAGRGEYCGLRSRGAQSVGSEDAPWGVEHWGQGTLVGWRGVLRMKMQGCPPGAWSIGAGDAREQRSKGGGPWLMGARGSAWEAAGVSSTHSLLHWFYYHSTYCSTAKYSRVLQGSAVSTS